MYNYTQTRFSHGLARVDIDFLRGKCLVTFRTVRPYETYTNNHVVPSLHCLLFIYIDQESNKFSLTHYYPVESVVISDISRLHREL